MIEWSRLPDIWPGLWDSMIETFYMVGLSMLAAILIGTPVGLLLYLTKRGALHENRWTSTVVGWIINVVRSFPFIILLVALIPFTRLVVGTSIGPTAASVSLSVAAIPFFARLVEQSLNDVPRGVVEAAVAAGASTSQIIRRVLLPEAMPALISSITVSAIAFVAFSAMAGAVGGGGIGDLAIRYGYYRFDNTVMIVCVVVLIVAVQILQATGSWLARTVDHR